jgi:hypothetical protein
VQCQAQRLAPNAPYEFHGSDMLTDDLTIRAAKAHTTLIYTGSDVADSICANDVRTEIQFDKSTNFLHYLSRSGVSSAPGDDAVEASIVWSEDVVGSKQLSPSELAAALCEGAGIANDNTIWGQPVKHLKNVNAETINKHAKASADSVWPQLMEMVGP